MSYKVNKQERQALKGLPHLPRLVYLEALRPYMDYQTGVIGVQRGVSYQSIAEELYIEPHSGYHSGSPSKDQIRRALKSLEKFGIIQLKSTAKKLIIVCRLADQDNFIQNKAATKATSYSATVEADFSAENTRDFEKNDVKAARLKKLKAATPPVSGYNTPSLAEHHVKIFWNFKPSAWVIEKAHQQNCPTADCQDELTKFICYHQSKGTRCCDWDAEFLRWLLRAKQYYQEKSHDRRQSNCKKQSASAVGRVIAAYQSDFAKTRDYIEHHEQ